MARAKMSVGSTSKSGAYKKKGGKSRSYKKKGKKSKKYGSKSKMNVGGKKYAGSMRVGKRTCRVYCG